MVLSQPDEGLLILLSDFLFLSSNQVVMWRATPAAQTYCSPEHHACKHVSENCDAIDDDVAGGLPAFEETLDVYR